jgi:hypothetical protein
MLVVVRCTECRGASRVEEPALGLLVQCPRCDQTFTAIEEAELIAPGPARADRGASSATLPSPPTRVRRLPEPPTALPAYETSVSRAEPEPDHDPHREPQGTLPASVLIGLALLPFLIPIFWLIASAITGKPPVLTIAAPLALAVSASILSMAVIYTVDWTPATRVKGVLMLVVLSFFTGVSLYFLNKDMVDRVKKFFGGESGWQAFNLADFTVRLPSHPALLPPRLSPLSLAKIDCFTTKHSGVIGEYDFVVGSGEPKPPRANDPAPGTDEWFDKVAADIVNLANGKLVGDATAVLYDGVFPGRELEIKLLTGSSRIVRVYFIKGKVYYLAVEGPMLNTEDEFALELFRSFHVTDAK